MPPPRTLTAQPQALQIHPPQLGMGSPARLVRYPRRHFRPIPQPASRRLFLQSSHQARLLPDVQPPLPTPRIVLMPISYGLRPPAVVATYTAPHPATLKTAYLRRRSRANPRTDQP